MNPPKSNQLWSDAARLPPANGKAVYEPPLPPLSAKEKARIALLGQKVQANLGLNLDTAPPIPRTSPQATQQVLPDAVVAQNIYREKSIPSERIATPGFKSPGQPLLPGMDEYFKQQADQGSWWQNLWHGAKRGFNWGINPPATENSPVSGYKGHFSKSIFERAPQSSYDDLGDVGRAGFAAGRVAADVAGHGSRHYLWNVHPEDFAGTYGRQQLQDASRVAMIVAPYAMTTALGLASGNYNPLNIAEGGRTAGYAAVNPDPEDPTKSTTPISELIIDRGMFGRKGKLLPWEQFKAERPDVSYDQYEKYKNYLFNKDDNLLRDATLGIAKGTLDGINGPELNVMGYSVTPLGAAAALGTLALAKRYAKIIS